MYKRYLFLVLLLSIVLGACDSDVGENIDSNKAPGNPTAEEILSEDTNADIFVKNNIVYTNAQHIEWVNDEDLSLGKEVGHIKKQTNNIEEFEDYTATKLPAGTKIYERKESKSSGSSGIYIVKIDGKEIPYLALIEG